MDMSAVTCPACGDDFVESVDGGCVSCLLQAADRPDPKFLIQEKLRYFGDFELKEPLGHGGMGMVFRAWQVSMRREVALKMINSGELASAEAVRRFRREAEAASLLDHPNIVKVYAVGEREGHQYIAMELAAGRDLAAEITSFQRDPRRACRIVTQIARAVHFAHQHGVLHRDLKPANVLVDEHDVALLTDFGLAKITVGTRVSSQSMTQSGRLLGTPAYMAPEQLNHSAERLTITAEVYTLGVILYETLTGRLPYPPGHSVDILNSIRANDIVPLRKAEPLLPRALDNICAKALRKDPKLRYQSAEELAADLDRWLNGETVLAKAESVPDRVVHWASRHRISIAITSILLTGFLVSTALLLRLREKSAREGHLVSAARNQLQTDLEKLWSDADLSYHKMVPSENLSILAGLDDSGIANGVHYSIGAYENNGQLTNSVQAYAPILNHLEKSLRRRGRSTPRFDLLLYKFNPTARAAFAQRKFDIGRFGANPYNLLRQANSDLVVLAAENSDHIGVIFVRKDSNIRTMEQLRGCSIAMGEESSTTSGTFAPALFYDHGLKKSDFSKIKWHPVNGRALEAVAAGECDAGVCGHEIYSRRSMTNLVILATFESQRAVWVARRSLGEPLINSLREALLSCPSATAMRLIGSAEKPFALPDPAENEAQLAAYAKRDAFFAGVEKPLE
ncbi:MAG TPA: serine/threonine-protein kinase [Verrucomicrobiae bacterium]|nr:serine/threonine-protein kinase [Verrucomicrobiae bacterium]